MNFSVLLLLLTATDAYPQFLEGLTSAGERIIEMNPPTTTTASTTTIVPEPTTTSTTTAPLFLLDPALAHKVGGNFALEGGTLYIWVIVGVITGMAICALCMMIGCAIQARCRCPLKSRSSRQEREIKAHYSRRLRSDRIQRTLSSGLHPPPPSDAGQTETMKKRVLTPKSSFVTAPSSIAAADIHPPPPPEAAPLAASSDMSLPPTPTELA